MASSRYRTAGGYSVRSAGGPGGRGGFRFTWNGAKVIKDIEDAQASMARQLQQDILQYLYTTLHRWPKHDYRRGRRMAELAFVEVYFTPAGYLAVRWGSDAPWTVYHEFRYHPQLRETADIFLPQVAERLRASMQQAGF